MSKPVVSSWKLDSHLQCQSEAKRREGEGEGDGVNVSGFRIPPIT